MAATAQSHKYKAVYDAIRNDIILRVYPAGSLIPTESELMEKYGVSRNTVRQALKLLQEEGFIITRRGSGSTVAEKKPTGSGNPTFQRWSSSHATNEYHVDVKENVSSPAVVDIVPVPPHIAKHMELETGQNVYRLQRVWYINGSPYNYMIQYMNVDITPGLPQHASETHAVGTLLEKYWGVKPLEKIEHISCRKAGFVESSILNVPVDSALMYTLRVATCSKGVYECAEIFGNPDIVGYIIQID